MAWVNKNTYGVAIVVACGLMFGLLGSTPRALMRQTATQAGPPRSIWTGVYTEAQAKRGQALYVDECANCHASNLGGNESAPALIGDDFAADWIGLTVGELFERTRVTMPQDSPGRLTQQQYADVTAFLLSANKYPAGPAELPPDTAALKRIQWDKGPPGPRQKLRARSHAEGYGCVRSLR
jgi:mono/diheme cytochrome c family protein